MSWPALVAWVGSVVLGVTLWQTGTLHLFFLAGPVWIVAAVVYIGLASVAGARETLAAEPPGAEPWSPTSSTTPAHGKSGAPAGIVWVVSGLVGLATLAACLLLPLWVYAAPVAEYASRLTSFKSWILAVTLLYFVAGTIWMNANEERRRARQDPPPGEARA